VKRHNRDLLDATLRRYARDCERSGSIYQQPSDHRIGQTLVTLVNTYGPVATYAYGRDKSGRVRLVEVQL
jgi:hypothetical protein